MCKCVHMYSENCQRLPTNGFQATFIRHKGLQMRTPKLIWSFWSSVISVNRQEVLCIWSKFIESWKKKKEKKKSCHKIGISICTLAVTHSKFFINSEYSEAVRVHWVLNISWSQSTNVCTEYLPRTIIWQHFKGVTSLHCTSQMCTMSIRLV